MKRSEIREERVNGGAAGVCGECGILYRSGFLPASHGVCPVCVDALDARFEQALIEAGLFRVDGSARLG